VGKHLGRSLPEIFLLYFLTEWGLLIHRDLLKIVLLAILLIAWQTGSLEASYLHLGQLLNHQSDCIY
jgi:hypothetical protein